MLFVNHCMHVFFTKCKVSSYKSCSSHSTHIATLQECVMYYFGAQSCVSVTRINVLKSVRVVSVYFSNLLMLIREGVNVLWNLFNVLVFVFFSVGCCQGNVCMVKGLGQDRAML